MNLEWILECVAALLAVDFVSGLVHWSEDTFGTTSTPILGRWIVAPNVSHHVDPTAFVSKSWLASSWDLSLASLLLAGTALLTGHFDAGIVLFAIFGANANEIHKWNHAPSRAPRAARVLWAAGLLQRPAQHARHHAREKNTHYCVITPFVNPLLDRTGFWRALERALVPVFGAPRREDLCAIRLLPSIRRRSSRVPPPTPSYSRAISRAGLRSPNGCSNRSSSYAGQRSRWGPVERIRAGVVHFGELCRRAVD